MSPFRYQTWILAFLALLAFAANSILCRLALGSSSVDPAGFTAIRLLSGAIALALLSTGIRGGEPVTKSGQWVSAIWLFLYAISFSFAYLSLTAGTGALILFGSVQVTMMTTAIIQGERPGAREWIGFAAAIGGLVYLVLPGLEAPPLLSALLMTAAGIAWGFYSLRGRGALRPLAMTAGNFLLTLPMAALLSLLFIEKIRLSIEGIALATASGAVASGIGYAIWYSALRGLTATRASVIQLAVPVLAAAGGVIFLAEDVSWRLVISALLILGGIILGVISRPSHKR